MQIQYNLTCHVTMALASELEIYLKETIRPKLLQWPGIESSTIFKIDMEVNDQTNSYSLQLNFKQVTHFETFTKDIEPALINSFTQKFGQNVFTFATVLKVI